MDVLKIKISLPTEGDTKTLLNSDEEQYKPEDSIYMVEFMSGTLDGKRWAVSGNLPIKKMIKEAEKDIKVMTKSESVEYEI